MKRALVALLFGCMTLSIASIAMAGDNDQAAITLHITPATKGVPCNNQPAGLTAAGIAPEVTGALSCTDTTQAWRVWMLVCNGSDSTGVAGAEFGLDYNGLPFAGLDVENWAECSDQVFAEPGFPAAGTGAVFAYALPGGCQITPSEPFVPRTVIAVLGWMDVFHYSPDIMSVIPRPNTGLAEIADCSGAQESILGFSPSHLGSAGFCAPGFNPCGLPTPVENRTWGNIKQSFQDN